jgi:Autophagy protein ATG17-like domain/Autophagy-related protein 11
VSLHHKLTVRPLVLLFDAHDLTLLLLPANLAYPVPGSRNLTSSVNNLRSHLAAVVPLSDQILLLGPPYKVPKDRDFQSDEILHSLRMGDAEDDPIHEEPAAGPSDPPSAHETTSSSLLKLPRRRLLAQSSSAMSTTTTSASSSMAPHRTVARRLFLFSKSALSSASPLDATPPCILNPQSIQLPTGDAQGPSPLADVLATRSSSSSSSPLHQALVAYESQFRKYLEQGRVLADAADMRIGSCVSCLQEQAVMARALGAAVSNLADHSGAATRAHAEFTATFRAKTSAHAQLLAGFEGTLQQLAAMPLHPSLIHAAARHRHHTSHPAAAAAAAATAGETSAAPMHPHMTTLLDTVPVERERNWMQQCQTSHTRLLALFQELDSSFAQAAFSTEGDDQFNLQLEVKWEQVQGAGKSLQSQQSKRLERLTASHSQVVKTILHAISSNSDADVQGAFVPLGELSEGSKSLVPDMLQADAELQRLQTLVADSKTEATRRLKTRLREISAAQSAIQKALSNLSVLRDALKQQCENMEHIEHVAELPNAYQQFLQEIQRRRAFGHAVAASSTALMERLAAMRDDEVKAREKFLRGPGRHLMPAFYEVFVPSLASPPPLFAPQLPHNEIDTLPDVSSTVGIEGAFSSVQVAEQHGVSSASTLTASGQQGSNLQQQPQDDHEMSSGVVGGVGQQQQQQDQLIVSASEQSGNDLYIDPATGAAAEAEARTLAYENMVLRQALERLGAKAPRSYVQDARALISAAGGSGAAAAAASAREEKALLELAAVQKELAETKARSDMATEALKAAAASSSDSSGLSDKISHSSFQVGDVGLFMPTGRGSGGKRTYLAFHTKCPYRFLSTDNIKGTPDFVLGRIVYQEELVAGELGTDANPYGLPVGTKFWVLTVEVLTSQA